MINILYLEDDETIHDVTKEYMKMQNYVITSAYDGQSAIDYIDEEKFSLIILDIMTPKVSGLDVLAHLHHNQVKTPIIMLSALGDEQIQIKAFNLLADDYIIKPFSPVLLLKRIEAILRRSVSENKLVSNDGLYIDKASYEVVYNRERLNLTLTEFLIFETMYENPNRVFTRDILLEKIFEDDYLVNDRVIDAHVKNLRKKLPVACIKTVIGLGYKYEAN